MATGTTNRQPKHRRPDRRSNVIQFVVTLFLRLIGRDLGRMRPSRQKTRGFPRLEIFRGQLITRDLPAHKFVKRLIRIQRPNDIVSVMPRVWPVIVLLVAMTLPIAYQIQPVTPPTLAVMWRAQQPVDDFFKSPWTRII